MSRLYKNKDKGSAKMISDLFFVRVCVWQNQTKSHKGHRYSLAKTGHPITGIPQSTLLMWGPKRKTAESKIA